MPQTSLIIEIKLLNCVSLQFGWSVSSQFNARNDLTIVTMADILCTDHQMSSQNDPSWEAFQYLLAIERHKTFSAAAKALGVNHTTVARQVRSLEQIFDIKLIAASKDGYILTEAGKQMSRSAKVMENEVKDLQRILVGQDSKLEGLVRITTFDIMATWLKPCLSDFLQKYPRIDISISLNISLSNLAKNEADIALRATSKPPENLLGTKLRRFEYALYGHRDHFNEKMKIEELPWIGWNKMVGATITDNWMQTNIPKARVRARVNSLEVMIQYVAHGLGVQYLPCLLAKDHPSLVRLSPINQDFGVDLWMLTPLELRKTARIRAVIQHIKEYFDQFPKDA